MKRGMSGKNRRGSPPLPRQRKALRVVQLTLLGVAVAVGLLAVAALHRYQHPLAASATLGIPGREGLGEVAVLVVGALGFAGLALSMGLRVVRGPDPRDPDAA